MRSQGMLTLLIAALALALATPSSGAVKAGHSGWEGGSPLPQGHAINALAFQSDVGYAVGDFGTVLKTGDGGATWSGLATGVTRDLSLVSVIDADSVVAGGGCTLRRSDDGGVTFLRLAWTPSDERCAAPLAALAFPTDRRGFLALQDGSVLRTDDGGSTWVTGTAIPVPGPTALAFTSPDVGVATTSAGLVYRTMDAGATWTLVALAPHGLRGLYFLTAQRGFAVGERSTVLETLNGGRTWQEKGTDSPLTLTSIRCATSLICLATSADTGNRLLRTSNGGETFDAVAVAGDVF